MAEFQFGHGQRFYLGHNNINDGNGVPGLEPLDSGVDTAGNPVETHPSPVTVNTITEWEEYETLRDVSFDGSPNTVDTTTRKEARLGNASQAIASTTRTRTLQIRYKPNESYTEANDKLYRLLLKAEKAGKEIAVMELDAPKNSPGALGFVSNCTVSLSMPKPVQDLVVVDVTATISTFGNYIVNDAAGTNFEAIGD